MLEEKIEGEEDIPLKKQIIVLPVMVALVVWYYIYTSGYIGRNFSDITRYTDSLWGDKTSLDMLARLFFITILCYGIIYAFYRKKMMIKTVFALLLVFLCAVEGIGNVKIYMASPSVNNTARTTDYVDAISLGDKISDKDFYRVTTDYWNTDYNMTGALGYNSISHYSSLNSHDFMAMQRQLGYSTVWIEAGYEEPQKVAEVEVTIEDGANVCINGDFWAGYYPIVNFTGEGDNARIMAWGYQDEEKGLTIGNGRFLRPINKLTNVTVDLSTCFANIEGEIKEVKPEFMWGPLYLPHSSESCTIKAHGFEYEVPQGFSSSSASFKDCTFEYVNIKTDNDEDLHLLLKVDFPSETKARTKFDLSFDTCDFSKVFQFIARYWGEFKKYEGFITLENTTMAKKAVTKDTKMIKYVNNAADGEQDPPVYHSTTFFVIDGTTYEPIEKDGVWKLIPVDD